VIAQTAEQYTYDPKFRGSNRAAAGTGENRRKGENELENRVTKDFFSKAKIVHFKSKKNLQSNYLINCQIQCGVWKCFPSQP
jgi:hypothetical protein